MPGSPAPVLLPEVSGSRFATSIHHDSLKYMFQRAIDLPGSGSETFFLWGPRQAGKSTLLRQCYPDGRWIDLLKTEEFRRYLTRPELLRQEIESEGPEPGRQIVIDEIQKVPALLDEVHWLMEHRRLHFALCGSSARKVRRGAANLLGGRAVRYELRGLTSAELGSEFDLHRILNHGYLPRMYEAKRPRRLLNAYIADYLREEIAAEGLVRNLPAFSRAAHPQGGTSGRQAPHRRLSRTPLPAHGRRHRHPPGDRVRARGLRGVVPDVPAARAPPIKPPPHPPERRRDACAARSSGPRRWG